MRDNNEMMRVSSGLILLSPQVFIANVAASGEQAGINLVLLAIQFRHVLFSLKIQYDCLNYLSKQASASISLFPFYLYTSAYIKIYSFNKRQKTGYNFACLNFHKDFHTIFDHHPSVFPHIMPIPGYMNESIPKSTSAP